MLQDWAARVRQERAAKATNAVAERCAAAVAEAAAVVLMGGSYEDTGLTIEGAKQPPPPPPQQQQQQEEEAIAPESPSYLAFDHTPQQHGSSTISHGSRNQRWDSSYQPLAGPVAATEPHQQELRLHSHQLLDTSRLLLVEQVPKDPTRDYY